MFIFPLSKRKKKQKTLYIEVYKSCLRALRHSQSLRERVQAFSMWQSRYGEAGLWTQIGVAGVHYATKFCSLCELWQVTAGENSGRWIRGGSAVLKTPSCTFSVEECPGPPPHRHSGSFCFRGLSHCSGSWFWIHPRPPHGLVVKGNTAEDSWVGYAGIPWTDEGKCGHTCP